MTIALGYYDLIALTWACKQIGCVEKLLVVELLTVVRVFPVRIREVRIVCGMDSYDKVHVLRS